ncbi:MAG TPA: hypothetical protein VHK69_01765 [Chitinophagaceae bacterium]|jgi:hypothetical protein|nr:hypothetical protein [Chitinophagaceae bacterium]
MYIRCFLSLLSFVLLLGACRSNARTSAPNEIEAIRSVIARETEAYYRQDFDAWRATYVDSPYFRSYGYWEGYPEKVRVYNGFDSLKRFKQEQFRQNKTYWVGSTEERSNENFRIYPNVAWYTFEQVSYEKDTRRVLGRSVETRILEKHRGQWKIAYLGFHYLPLK